MSDISERQEPAQASVPRVQTTGAVAARTPSTLPLISISHANIRKLGKRRRVNQPECDWVACMSRDLVVVKLKSVIFGRRCARIGGVGSAATSAENGHQYGYRDGDITSFDNCIA